MRSWREVPVATKNCETVAKGAQLMSGCGVSVCGRQFAVPACLIYLPGRYMAAPAGRE